jgi:hypothetical protein
MEDPARRTRALNSELANGRLAMVAILGIRFQNGTFGTSGPERWLLGRAFESERRVQAPFGFWDPMGFCQGGDVADFKHRRESDLKRGLVAMCATLCSITPG